MNIFNKIKNTAKGIDPNKIKNEIKHEIKNEIIDEVLKAIDNKVVAEVKAQLPNIPDEIKKNLPNIRNEARKFLEDNIGDVVHLIKKYGAEKIVEEVEAFAKDRIFSVTSVFIDTGKDLNRMAPCTGFELHADIAGNGITATWDGHDQLERVLAATENAIADKKITSDEMKQILTQITPAQVTLHAGAAITLAIIGGTTINTASNIIYTKEGIGTLIKNWDEIIEKLFIDLPRDVLKAAITGK